MASGPLPDAPGRVTVVVAGHVGRNLFCTPALRLIRRRWPDARVRVVATSRRGALVFANNPDVDEVVVGRTLRGLRWAAHDTDVIIGLCRRAAADTLAALRIPMTWPDDDVGTCHRAEASLRFVSDALDVDITSPDRHYVLPLPPRARSRAAMLLSLRAEERAIGLHLGSGWTYNHGWNAWTRRRVRDRRLWSIDHWIATVRLLARTTAVRIVLTGSPGERFLARRFLAAVPDALDLVGRTSLHELAAVMERLDVFVSADSGPMHVATAVDRPIVGLFGPTDPATTGPYPRLAHHRILHAPATDAIAPRDVATAIASVLQTVRAAHPP